MTKILSMFFTGLTLLSHGSFANANATCFAKLSAAVITKQTHEVSSFGSVLLNGQPKEQISNKSMERVFPQEFINDFCSSEKLHSRTDELAKCFADAFEADFGSEVQPTSQKVCMHVLLKYPKYETFQKCFDHSLSKFKDARDAFEACM